MVEGRVSVIIPVFNREEFVVRAVESCLDQTYKEIEVVCVDDASTDSSFARLSDMSNRDARVKAIRNERYKGVAGARNTGMLRSTGEYIAFLDSDDMFKPMHVQSLMETLNTSDAAWAFSNFERSTASGRVTEASVIGANSRYITSAFSRRSGRVFVSDAENHAVNFVRFMHTPGLHTSLIRRRAIERLSFDERLEMFEDWKFRFDAILRGVKFAYLDVVTHRYYSHEGNTTTTAGRIDIAKGERMAAAYSTLMAIVNEMDLGREVRGAFAKKSADMLFWELGIPLLRLGEWKQGRRLLFRGLLGDPLNVKHLRAVLSILVKRRV